VTGTAWEHQREVCEARQAIVPGLRLATAVSRLSEEGADREAAARALEQPPASPAPAPLDHSIP
jgi:hypothetical protein